MSCERNKTTDSDRAVDIGIEIEIERERERERDKTEIETETATRHGDTCKDRIQQRWTGR